MAQSTSKSLTFEYALKVFLLDGQTRNLSEKTLATYRQQLNWAFEFLRDSGADQLSDVTSIQLKSYIVHSGQCVGNGATICQSSRPAPHQAS